MAAHLQLWGLQTFPYLNVWLVKAPSLHRASEAISTCLQRFRSLGLSVNYQKYVLTPCQWITFLRIALDTLQNKAFLSAERQNTIFSLAYSFAKKEFASVCLLKSFLGMMSSAILMVSYADLSMRPSQEQVDRQWLQVTGSFEDIIQNPPIMKNAFPWWQSTSNSSVGPTFLSPLPEFVMTMDASL